MGLKLQEVGNHSIALVSLKWGLHNECNAIFDGPSMVNFAPEEVPRVVLGQHGDLFGVKGETLESLTRKARNFKKHLNKVGMFTV